ncbi:MAG: hypothetical protein N2490_05165 [Ignavibacteria bacterium]|nr:hypothetical protein [Ignavibacteria bacterium]
MPSELRVSKILFLISSIINLLYAGFSLIGTMVFGAFTCGCGCISILVPIFCTIVSVMDYIAFDKLNNLDQINTYNTLQTATILEIITILTGNIIVMVFGIINLLHIQRQEVKDFLRSKNIY